MACKAGGSFQDAEKQNSTAKCLKTSVTRCRFDAKSNAVVNGRMRYS